MERGLMKWVFRVRVWGEEETESGGFEEEGNVKRVASMVMKD